jgi:hypothetical protein
VSTTQEHFGASSVIFEIGWRSARRQPLPICSAALCWAGLARLDVEASRAIRQAEVRASKTMRRQVQGKVPANFVDAGDQSLKNIANRIEHTRRVLGD